MTMTPMRLEIYNEIENYYKRMGKWPTLALIRSITKHNQSSFSTRVTAMCEDGILEKGEWINGKSREIRIVN